MSTQEAVRAVLRDCLHLGSRADRLASDTALFGSLPELDSMSVMTVLTALEERFGFIVEDEDVKAETFASLQSLCDFVERKRTA